MAHSIWWRWLVLIPFACWLAGCAAPAPAGPRTADELVVATWNILHGGREDGAEVGPARVAERIHACAADLVAIQETYGSGELLAQGLGMRLHARGTNVSILSRHEILADVSVDVPFSCVGAVVRLPSGRPLAFYSLWLPYDADIWLPGVRAKLEPAELMAATAGSAARLAAIVAAIPARLAEAGFPAVPVVLAGDFNAMSHLDYTAVARDQFGIEIPWPTSLVVAAAGYQDAYRLANPRVDRRLDSTWSPRFPEQEQDRIDFVHCRGDVQVLSARNEPVGADFPSDHRLVTARLRVGEAVPPLNAVRAASYNIRHGRGMDDRVDLERTAAVLAQLNADVIALQEVDLGVRRSGGINQPEWLGARLGMHPAFGSFLDYQGGRYGMAILSKWPLRAVRSLRLPDGNEPRVALVAELVRPDGEVLTVVNVHFDWVADDHFRYAQAEVVAQFVAALPNPYLVVGDCNDVPGSRTVQRFAALSRNAAKPIAASNTFPSPAPTQEIDYVFAGPVGSWRAASAEVIAETLASDHRPLVAVLVPTTGNPH